MSEKRQIEWCYSDLYKNSFLWTLGNFPLRPGRRLLCSRSVCNSKIEKEIEKGKMKKKTNVDPLHRSIRHIGNQLTVALMTTVFHKNCSATSKNPFLSKRAGEKDMPKLEKQCSTKPNLVHSRKSSFLSWVAFLWGTLTLKGGKLKSQTLHP